MTNYRTNDKRDEQKASPQTEDATYELEAGELHSTAVVRAVATFTNTSVLDLDPLYDVLDPDHLDGIFAGSDEGM